MTTNNDMLTAIEDSEKTFFLIKLWKYFTVFTCSGIKNTFCMVQ